MKYAIVEGLRRMLRAPGLALLLYATNLLFAALLALPLIGELEGASAGPLSVESGPFWTQWSQGRRGWTSEMSPDIFGSGTFFVSAERLLGGELPAGAFSSLSGVYSSPVDGVVLGLGVAYLIVMAFFQGGLLGTYRALRGTWSPNGFFHGSAFYFGRMVRTGLVGLAFAALAFTLHAPLAGALASAARATRSESSALALGFLSHGALMALLLFVSMVTAYARVIIVAEERRSALLAWLSALVFSCGRSFPTAYGHSLVMATLTAIAALGWARLDALVSPSLPAVFVLGQLFVLARVGMGLTTLAGRFAVFSRAAGRE